LTKALKKGGCPQEISRYARQNAAELRPGDRLPLTAADRGGQLAVGAISLRSTAKVTKRASLLVSAIPSHDNNDDDIDRICHYLAVSALFDHNVRFTEAHLLVYQTSPTSKDSPSPRQHYCRHCIKPQTANLTGMLYTRSPVFDEFFHKIQ